MFLGFLPGRQETKTPVLESVFAAHAARLPFRWQLSEASQSMRASPQRRLCQANRPSRPTRGRIRAYVWEPSLDDRHLRIDDVTRSTGPSYCQG